MQAFTYRPMDRPENQCLPDRGMQMGQFERFRQTQKLNIFALALLPHPRLRQSAQGGGPIRQIPALQRCGLIQRPGFCSDSGR